MLLEAKGLNKTYGKGENAFAALKNVSLGVDAGQTVAIVGKSGSGKSTLMHVLAALDRVDDGSISFNGAAYEKSSARTLDRLRSQKFGFIFQQFFLNGRETVLENVMLPLKIGGFSFSDRRKRAMKALEDVDMVDKTENKATDLSGGQKQRVAIARALVNDPEVIFADEPTGNLDSENGKRVIDLLFNMNRDRNITLIIVTHDHELAAMCQHQYMMKDGVLSERKAEVKA